MRHGRAQAVEEAEALQPLEVVGLLPTVESGTLTCWSFKCGCGVRLFATGTRGVEAAALVVSHRARCQAVPAPPAERQHA